MNRMVVGMLILCLSILVVFAGGTVAGEEVETEEIPEELYDIENDIAVQYGESVTIDEKLSGESGTVDVVVRFSASLDTSSVEAMKQSARDSHADMQTVGEHVDGIELQNTFWIMNAAVVSVDTEQVSVETLRYIDGVERLHANFEVEPTDATTVPPAVVGSSADDRVSPTNYETTYGLEQIGATEVWDEHGTQGEGTIVTVLDTGIDPDHPDLNLAEWQEFDSSGNEIDSDPFDEGDHGTHVSGTVAGGDASGEHIGVAPETELHHGGVLTDNSGTFTAVAAGIEWGVNNGADVVTMSLGVDGGGYISTLVEPIYNAEQTGTVIVGSAGNEGDGATSTPGNTYDGIGVGASNEDEGIRDSSSGEVIDTDDAWGSDALSHWPSEYVIPAVAAPGASVYSSEPGNSYGFKSGTSMAAPHVAGAAALMQSATDTDVQPTEIKAALEATAWKPADWDEPDDERDTRYGSGIIDIPAAIDYLEGAEQVTVVDFNWPLDSGGSCPSESVDDLSLYFSGDMSSSDDDFHIDDGSGGDESPPDGGCVLRSEGESASITSTPGGQTSDLEYYPERGDEITFNQYAHNIRTGIGGGDGADFEFRFGVQDDSNYYYVRTEVDDPPFELVLGYVSGGTDITLDSTDIEDTVDDGTYQTMHIEWGTDDSDSITATYAGEETVSATSTLYDEGGIGFERVGTQGSVYSYTHLVDEVTATTEATDGPEFEITSIDYPDTIDIEDDLDVEYTVENVGDETDTESYIDLRVDDSGTSFDDSDTDVTLAPGETWTNTLTFDEVEENFNPGETVTFSVELWDFDDEASGSTEIIEEDAPDIVIQSIDYPDEVTPSENLEVEYTLENVGDESGTESAVELLIDGTVEDSDSAITLAPGETESGTLIFDDVAGYEGEELLVAVGDGVGTTDNEANVEPTIDPAIARADGEVDALVYLEPAATSPLMDADTVVETLQSQAEATQPDVVSDLESQGVSVENKFWLVNALAVSYDASEVSTDRLADAPGVIGIYENAEIEMPEPVIKSGTPTPAIVGDVTYGLDQINAPDVWDEHGATGEDSIVVIQDNGFDVNHEALDVAVDYRLDGSGNIVGDAEVDDDNPHGTHVAGTATGGEDSSGVAIGVAPGAELHAHDIFSEGGVVGAAIGSKEEAVNEGAAVVSGSWGSGCNNLFPDPVYNDDQIDPIENARLAGTEVISASGNAGDCVGGFANDFESFAIGATDDGEDVTSFSSGSLVDKDDGQPNWEDAGGFDNPPAAWPQSWVEPRVAAPGDDVYSAFPFDDYESISGTSMAAPHVAGAIGLIQSATDDEHTGPEIRDALEETAWKPDDWNPSGPDIWTNADSTHDQPGIDSRYGYGIIDTMAAIDYLNDGDDVISFTVALDSFDDTESGQTTIVEESDPEPELSDPAVDGETFDATITEGEDVDASVVVENVGGEAGSFTVDLQIVNGDTYVDKEQTTSELEPGETETVVFEEVTGDLEPGEFFVDFFAGDDGTFADLTVEEGEPESDLSEPAVGGEVNEATITEGEDKNASVVVENIGTAAGSFDIDLEIVNGESYVQESQTTSELDPGETETVVFDAVTGDLPPGEFWVDFLIDGSGVPLDLTVEEAPESQFDVSITDTNEPTEGELLEVDATIENTGGTSDEQSVMLDAGTLGTDEQTVSLDASESTTETFTVETEAGDAGEHTATLESEDDEDSSTVTVLEPAEFSVDIDEADDVVQGNDVEVVATIENVGEVTDEQSVELTVPTVGTDDQIIELAGGDTTTETFAVPTSDGDTTGTYTITVESEDDDATTDIDILEPPEFTVDIDSVNEPVAGEDIVVDATIENTGEATDEQTVELSVAGLGDNSTSVELDGGESTTETFSVPTNEGDEGGYSLTVTTDDDETEDTVTVIEPAFFAVTIDNATEPVAGDDLLVNATIENSGEATDEQTVELDVGGLGTDNTTVTLDGGDAVAESFTVPTDEGDDGTYTAVLESEDDTDQADVTVLKPAEFSVEILGATTSDSLVDLSYELENIGDVEATQTLTFTVDDTETSTREHTLAGGANETDSFEYELEHGDAPEVLFEIASEDDSAEQPVSIAPAELEFSDIEANDPVVEGEPLELTLTATNTGEEPADETVELTDFDDSTVDSDAVSLTGEESTQLTLVWETEVGDAGSDAVTVDGETTTQSVPVEILAQAGFAVSIDEVNEPVAGDDLLVNATIENTGDVSDEQTVSLDVEGLGAESTTVELDGGESVTETLTVETTTDDAGTYNVTVATDDNETDDTVTVLEPAEFQITEVSANEPVAGEDIEVTATIENAGEVADEQVVSLDVDGLETDNTTVEIVGGDATTETLTIETGEDDAGNYTAAVTTDDDDQTTTVTVLEPAAFQITEVSANEPVAGEDIEVTTTIENTGDVSDEQTVSLDVDGLDTASTTVELDGGDATTETLTIETTDGDAGNYTAAVTTDDASQPIDVTVTDTIGPKFELGEVTVSDTVAGDALEVSAVIENTGDELGTVTVNASAAAFGTDETTVDVAANETETAMLTLETEMYQAGTHDLTVESAGESETESVMVSPPPVSEDADAPTDMEMADGLYEDITGDGTLTIADIQMLFESLENDEVQQNSEFYDFAGLNPDEVTIFDIQALFNLYAEN